VDDARDRLLHAAGEVFSQKGFEAATIREICTKGGVNVAAVNYYFGDKEHLYLEAVKQAHCTQENTAPPDWPPGASAEQKLRAFVGQMMTDMLDDARPSWHLALMMREMAEPTAACAELVKSFIGPKFALLGEILHDLLPADATPDERHLAAFSVVGQCLLYRFHRAFGRLLIGDEQFERFHNVDLVAEHITRFSLEGLRGLRTIQPVGQERAP
jgi:AcrR family transcriptional regulator